MAIDRSLPPHVVSFLENLGEVEGLLGMRRTVTARKAAQRRRASALTKSAVVMLVACWEAYVEDLASASFDDLLASAKSPADIPPKVLSLAAKPLRDDKDERRVWALAGEGWRNVLQFHKLAVVDRYIGTLNTPRSANIDTIFSALVGFNGLSSTWRWRNMSNTRAVKVLEDLVTLRGEIAHRVSTSRDLSRDEVFKLGAHLNRLAAISSNQLARHLERISGRRPWMLARYGSTG